ncbi:hypothetical protein RUM43_009707 [Polyplax serrata]|uniref:CHK kinase-like domain-containing protein n=1 Tax=Polyplax serrata TaxID=468196 RepID=A0AAN8S9U8_POLSC
MTELATHDNPPEWFSDGFIEKAMRNGLKQDDLEVVGMEIKKAAAAGDHYASSLFRCHLKLKQKKCDGKEKTGEISVIVKIIPGGMMGDELKKFSIFEKEAEILSNVLPKITEIIQRAYPEEEPLGPNIYYHEGSPNNVIVMEDLKIKNFNMANRIEGLDVDHTTLVLKGLAKYHAASLVLKKERPETLTNFAEAVWNRKNKDMVEKFFMSTLTALSEDFPSWEDMERKEIIQQKLKVLQREAFDKVLNLFDPIEEGMEVLLHGDSWVNNFMFKYNPSGVPVEMKFVDFQLCYLNSPAMDLQYFLFSSTREDLRFTQIDTFLRIYHEAFEDALDKLNFPLASPYKFDQLKKDFNDRSLWGLLVFCSIFPLFKVPQGETMQPDDLFLADSNRFRVIFQREDVRKVMVKGLLYFDRVGAL